MKKTIFPALAALLLLLQLEATPVYAQPQKSAGTIVDGIAAVVGKNIVKYSDVERSFAQMRLRSGMTDAQNSRCAILENLILTQLLVHKGEVDSVEVSDEEVNQYLESFLQGDLERYGSKEAIREATGFAYDELKEQYDRMIRTNLLSRSVEYSITENVKVTPAEVTEFFNSLPADSLPMMPERYEIPLIMVGGAIAEPRRVEIIGSQHDLAATLLAQLGVDHSQFIFSKNMLDETSPHFAFFTVPDAFGFVTTENRIIFDNKALIVQLYRRVKRFKCLKRYRKHHTCVVCGLVNARNYTFKFACSCRNRHLVACLPAELVADQLRDEDLVFLSRGPALDNSSDVLGVFVCTVVQFIAVD